MTLVTTAAQFASPAYFPPGDFGPGTTGKNDWATWKKLEDTRWFGYKSAAVGTLFLNLALFIKNRRWGRISTDGIFSLGFFGSAVCFYLAASNFTSIMGFPYDGLEEKTPRFEAFGGANLGIVSSLFLKYAITKWKGRNLSLAVLGSLAIADFAAYLVYDAFQHPKPKVPKFRDTSGPIPA